MGIGSFILPYEAAPKRMVEGYLFICGWLVYMLSGAWHTGKTGFKMGINGPDNLCDRSKNPRGYWFIMIVYFGLLVLATQQLLSYVS